MPHREEGQSLATIFGAHGFDDEVKLLSRALFRHDRDEWDLVLSEGYQARPHVGAAALLNAEGGDFWESLQQIIRGAATQNVRIFLAGSVFGGTGAAGFPTLARKIRKFAETNNVAKGVMISGVLMTPYFRFDAPKHDADTALRSEELMYQAQIALDYYDDLFKREAVFDTLYLVGWNRLFHLPYYSRGKQAQHNPPLMPELYAALAAAEMFGGKHVSRAKAASIFAIAGEKDDEIGWSDLPSTISGPGDRNVYQSLARWMRFNFAWRYIYRPELDAEARRLFGIGHSRWFRSHCSGIDFKSAEIADDLKRLDAWTDRSLLWAASLANWSGRQSMNEFRLWDDFYAEHDGELPSDPPKFCSDTRDFDGKLEQLIHLSKAEESPEIGMPLFQRVARVAPHMNSKGLGRLIHAIFEEAGVKLHESEGTL